MTAVSTDREGDAPRGAPPTARRTPLQLLVIALLILVPTGYGAIAAVQSRNNDGDKTTSTKITGLVWGWPSRMQRSVYRVPLPYNAVGVGYQETSAWRSSSLYVHFTTTGGGLDTFLAQLGTGREALRDGRVTVPGAASARVGWHFAPGHRWAGIALASPGSAPDHRITVNLDNPDLPSVFLLSTTDFD